MKNNFTKIKVNRCFSKWKIASLFIFLIFVGMQSAKAQYTAIPDANFEQRLITLGIDSGAIDHQVLTANVSSVTYLYVSSKSISSLVGIQAFTSLTDLYCSNNLLTSLNLSGLNNLSTLYCNENKLTTLNLSGCTSLQSLNCRYNYLPALNLSSTPNLLYLVCGGNQFTSLNVASLTNLNLLDCGKFHSDNESFSVGYDLINLDSILIDNYASNAPISSLTVTGLANLGVIYSSGNNLSSLNLTGLTSLSILKSQNNISSINLSGLSNLTVVDLAGNPLTSLNISGLNNLVNIFLPFTNLTDLNASALTHLKDLVVQGCPNLTSLNVAGCTALVNLNCSDSKLSSLNISSCSSLETLQCEDNLLTGLNLSGLAALKSLSCGNYMDVPGSRNQITSINFTGATSLTSISCEKNLLSNLNLSGLTNLTNLDCSNNAITTLNLTGLNALGGLYCSNNTITTLTLPGSIALTGINCSGNQISSLNLSGFSNLFELNVASNLLTNLDLRNLTNLTNMDASNNTLLTCISTDNVNVANANSSWTKDASTNYSTNCTSYIPTTKVRTSQCGITLAALSSKIAANLIPGAQMYRFEVSNGVIFNTVQLNSYNFSLTTIPGITYGTTYGVRVAVKIGDTWGAFGSPCSITTPALSPTNIPTTKVKATFCETTIALLSTKIPADVVYGAEGYRFEVTRSGTTAFYESPVYNFKLSQTSLGATSGTAYTIRVAAKVNGVYGNYGASCIVYTPGESGSSKTIEETKLAINDKLNVKAYPNPFVTNFKFDFSSSSESNVEVVVYDMIGRQLEKLQGNISEMNYLEIGNSYPSGVYNVIITQGEDVKTIRVFKR